MKRLLIAIAALVASAGAADAQIAPPTLLENQLIVATSSALAPTLDRLARSFAETRPDLPKPTVLALGSDVAMAYLSSGKAHIAIIGREATDPEIKAFQWVFNRPPRDTPVMRGCAKGSGCSADLALLVHPSNPVRSVTMAQMGAALAPGRLPAKWRVLARATGASAPIDVFLPGVEGGTGRFIRKRLARNQVQFAWRQVNEIQGPAGPAALAIARAVARNRNGLGIAPMATAAGLRALGIRTGPTTVFPGDTAYPLARTVHAFADPAQRAAQEFLVFTISPRGQEVVRQGPYRPLLSQEIAP